MKCCCGLTILSDQVCIHSSQRGGQGILTIWFRVYWLLLLAVGFGVADVFLWLKYQKEDRSLTILMFFVLFSILPLCACQCFFGNRYDYRFNKNRHSLFLRKRGNLCFRGVQEQVEFHDIVSVDRKYQPAKKNSEEGDKYHLEIRQRNNNIARIPMNGTLFKRDSEILRDEIRTFLGKGGVDTAVVPVPIGIQNQKTPHDDDHHEDNGGRDGGNAGPVGGDDPKTELCV
jgi:hypothetical protein